MSRTIEYSRSIAEAYDAEHAMLRNPSGDQRFDATGEISVVART